MEQGWKADHCDHYLDHSSVRTERISVADFDRNSPYLLVSIEIAYTSDDRNEFGRQLTEILFDLGRERSELVFR